MFALMGNFYHWVRKKQEKKVTLVLIGLDNAGKTTLLNTVKGELDKEVTPTMGFNPGGELPTKGKFSKYTVEVFDLGGGSKIRKIWKTYFPEVHGVIYVLDAADKSRFEEAREELERAHGEAHLHNKPLLLFANKQDLPAASSPEDIEAAMGLSKLHTSAFNMVPCVARCEAGATPDTRISNGVNWLMGMIDSSYGALSTKVATDMEEVRQAEEKRKEERAIKMAAAKAERARKLAEQEAEAAATVAAVTGLSQDNALSALPNQIMSPGKVIAPHEGLPGDGEQVKGFSDLNGGSRGSQTAASRSRLGASSSGTSQVGASTSAIPVMAPPPSSSRPASAARHHNPTDGGLPHAGPSGSRPASAASYRSSRPAQLELSSASARAEAVETMPSAMPAVLPPSERPISHLGDAIHTGAVVESKVDGMFRPGRTMSVSSSQHSAEGPSAFNLSSNNKVAPEVVAAS